MKHFFIVWIALTFLPLLQANNDPFFHQDPVDTEIFTPEESFSPIPLNLYSLPLQHAKASELVEELAPLFPEINLSFNARTNQLLLQSTQEDYLKVKKMIASLDKSLPQILIEARIVTMNDLSLQELGVRWGIFDRSSSTHHWNGSLGANFPQANNNNLNVNLGVLNPAGSASIQLASINGRLLDLELSALEKENAVKIIASPKLLTTNQHKAKIEQGTELPYVVNGKDDTQDVEFKDAVLSLEVTPQLSKDRKILMDLKITQNTPGEQSKIGKNEFVAIEKQELDTQVLARHGETIVLGGIFHDTVTEYVQKVPFLGDVPVMKHLFRKTGEKHQKRELIIFVTPHIVEGDERGVVDEVFKGEMKMLF